MKYDMSMFKIAKERTRIIDVAVRYGIAVKGGKALCCFHKEKTPSLSFKNDYFMCFGCGEKGDVVSFVTKIFGISSYEALKKLNEDFGLGFNIGSSIHYVRNEISEYQWETELKAGFEKWVRDAFIILNHHVHMLKDNITKYEPKTQEETFHPLFVGAVKTIDYYDHLLDELTYGDEREKVILYKTIRKEVRDIGRRQQSYLIKGT